MIGKTTMGELIASAWDGATGACRWDRFLARAGDALTATVSVLFSQVPGRRESGFLGVTGLDAGTIRNYREHYAARNILMTLGEAQHRPGIVRTSETICPSRVLLRSEYYNDFMRPLDTRYSIALTPVREPDRAIHLSLFRPEQAGPFGDAERRLMSDLSPHLTRALQVHLVLAEQRQRVRLLEQSLEEQGRAVAFLDSGGRVLFVNRVLDAVLARKDGLSLTRRGLAADAPSAGRRLQTAIAEAAAGGPPSAVLIERPSGERPYAVLVAPVPADAADEGAAQARVSVVIAEPDRPPGLRLRTLQDLYGLTAAETRLLDALARGQALGEIADAAGISVHTARTHLKRVLSKTGTHRQGDLIRLVHSVA